MTKLSVVIITRNEEANIRDCLESVKWADEIIVVDAFSEDATVDICREYTTRVYQRRWEGFASQRRYAGELATGEWLLVLDADERVTPELRQEIQALLRRGPGADGYYLPRRGYFLGKGMRHGGWYPGYQLRLLRKASARVTPSRVHEGYVVEGSVGYLKSELVHRTHPTLEASIDRLNRYSTLEALDRANRKRVHWWDFITHPMATFLSKYIGQKAFLDGMHGFLLAVVSAMVKMMVYMKGWELQRLGARRRGQKGGRKSSR